MRTGMFNCRGVRHSLAMGAASLAGCAKNDDSWYAAYATRAMATSLSTASGRRRPRRAQRVMDGAAIVWYYSVD